MATKITLTIPDPIYQQVLQAAQAQELPLADIINSALVQAFPPVDVHPKRQQMEQELLSFHSQKTELLGKYPGQYIAMFKGEVIDSDTDQLALVARIDSLYPDEIILIKQVTDSPEKILHSRSPRLV